jgi:hypothetical protein
MIARVVSEVEQIARGVGFGQVTIVIEKGQRVGLRRARANGGAARGCAAGPGQVGDANVVSGHM